MPKPKRRKKNTPSAPQPPISEADSNILQALAASQRAAHSPPTAVHGSSVSEVLSKAMNKGIKTADVPIDQGIEMIRAGRAGLDPDEAEAALVSLADLRAKGHSTVRLVREGDALSFTVPAETAPPVSHRMDLAQLPDASARAIVARHQHYLELLGRADELNAAWDTADASERMRRSGESVGLAAGLADAKTEVQRLTSIVAEEYGINCLPAAPPESWAHVLYQQSWW